MYKIPLPKAYTIKRDDGGYNIEIADGFVLWRGLSPDAVRNLATKSLFCELSLVEKQLEKLLST